MGKRQRDSLVDKRSVSNLCIEQRQGGFVGVGKLPIVGEEAVGGREHRIAVRAAYHYGTQQNMPIQNKGTTNFNVKANHFHFPADEVQ